MRTALPIHLIFLALTAFQALPLVRRAWLGTLDEGQYMVFGSILLFTLAGWLLVVQSFHIWWVPPGEMDPVTGGRIRRRR